MCCDSGWYIFIYLYSNASLLMIRPTDCYTTCHDHHYIHRYSLSVVDIIYRTNSLFVVYSGSCNYYILLNIVGHYSVNKQMDRRNFAIFAVPITL